MMALISVENLSKDFGGFKAVDNISFSVKKGEVLGFLGPNGAGKTTTMRMITGYLAPTSGRVKICDIDILNDLLSAQKKIGYLPEGGPLYNDMTPCSFLNFIADIRGLKEIHRDDRMDYVISNLHLADVFYKPIEKLSKGYKRRVALAAAILHDPEVLILDEPTDGLDPNQKHEVRKLISQMAKEKAIIISTHILEEVEALCSKVLIISKGKIVASGTVDDLLKKSPEHNNVIVKLKKGSSNSILNDVLKVKNVDKVNVESDDSIVAFSKKGQDILRDVGDAVRKKEVEVEAIYSVKGKFDDAFRKLTGGSK